MLSFDADLTNALKNSNTTAFWVLKLYYNDESAFIGVSDRHRQDGTDIYYGIVASWGVYRQSLDFFNFTTSTANMTVTLINADNSIKGGRFTDLFATNNFENRKWELFLNTNETATLDTAARMIGTGIISGEVDYDRNNMVLSLLNNNSKYHKMIPTATVDSATYPNAPENNIGKPIPMAFGDFYEKTDIGTIPTGHFDRFRDFYKGAFPAIVTDKFDVGVGGSEAKADSQSLHTLDNENIYYYKNNSYATNIDTNVNSITNNPVIEFTGARCKVYFPVSTSGFTTSGTGTHTNEANISNGDFSDSSKTTIACDSGNNVTVTYGIPPISKLGEYVGVTAITKLGNVLLNASASTFTGLNQFRIGNIAYSADDVTSNAEVSNSIASVFSGDTSSWNFEGTLDYKLLAGADDGNLSFEVLESGIVVEFDIDDIEKYREEVLHEEYREKIVEVGSFGPDGTWGRHGETEVIKEKVIVGITPAFAPSVNIDYIYYSGKGREYGAYIDADSRNNGYNKGDLIENPIYIIESILRSELGNYFTGAATSTTSNKLVDSGASFPSTAVGQTVYNTKDATSAMVTAVDSSTTLSIDANIMASGETYIISGLTSDEIDFASFDASGNTSNGLIANIYEDAVADVKFAFNQFKFINSFDLIEKLTKMCFSYVFISGDGKIKIKTLQSVGDYTSADVTINFNDINLNKISKTSLNGLKNEIIIKYNYDIGLKQTLSEVTSSDATSQGSTVNGFNKKGSVEYISNSIIDDTTATKLAAAYKNLMKSRKNILRFSTNSPKYNHLEIGDIVNFTNFTVPKIYGTEVNDGSTNKFYIITDISKSITSADIECIQVGDVDV